MVPRLLRGLMVVSLIGIFAGMLMMYRALAAWEDQGAEGPYRRRENCRCVCK